LKELKAADKVVQQMSRDGLVEVNKSTGEAANISARDTDTTAINAQSHGDDSTHIIGGVVSRVQSERVAAKKRKTRKANAKIYEGYKYKPEEPRLKFTDAERTDLAMAKTVRKSDKSVNRYEKAQAKIPKEKSITLERVSDKPSGKSKTRLVFKESNKPNNGKLTHALDRPKRETAHFVHGKVSKVEGENTGVQAAHSAEKAAEYGARKIGDGYRRLKFLPHRAAFRAEEKVIKANSNALYQRSLRLNPELRKANPLSKALHKRRIKRQYAQAFRAGKTGAKATAVTLKKAVIVKSLVIKAAVVIKLAMIKAAKAALAGKVLLVIAAVLLVLMLIMVGVTSCMSMFGGGINAIISTSYTAEDADILGAHGNYTALENQLENRIANIPAEFPGYDEYRFYIDTIGHNPHELISYLTARFHAFSMTDPEVQAAITALFQRQYILTITSIVEVRTRTESRTGTGIDEDGNSYSYTYSVTVQYNWYILVTTLTNRTMRTAILENLTADEAERWHILMETQGNRPDLFGGGGGNAGAVSPPYGIPPGAMDDERFAAMFNVAQGLVGIPYVWGGSNPASGFDCSGFVSWVINQSGVGNVGRTNVRGLYAHTTTVPRSQAQPGDLIFFVNTFAGAIPNVPSHVGIYLGNNTMIHAGSPVGFANINNPFWVNHFYAFGRLP